MHIHAITYSMHIHTITLRGVAIKHIYLSIQVYNCYNVIFQVKVHYPGIQLLHCYLSGQSSPPRLYNGYTVIFQVKVQFSNSPLHKKFLSHYKTPHPIAYVTIITTSMKHTYVNKGLLLVSL